MGDMADLIEYWCPEEDVYDAEEYWEPDGYWDPSDGHSYDLRQQIALLQAQKEFLEAQIKELSNTEWWWWWHNKDRAYQYVEAVVSCVRQAGGKNHSPPRNGEPDGEESQLLSERSPEA